MNHRARVVAGLAALAALTVFAAPGRPTARAGTVVKRASASWPERVLVRDGVPAADEVTTPTSLYALISRTHTPMRGPYQLERTDLRTGSVRKGSLFAVGHIAVASGYVWVYGARNPESPPRVAQVDSRTLAPIRSIRLPADRATYAEGIVTAGPRGSVWIGTSRHLLRVDAATGAALVRVTAPPGLAVGDLAVDPSGRYLYVSTAHIVRGGVEGGAVFEYDARSGRELAYTARGLITYSVAGAGLTAVPGGVWASFRTGMLGLTIHLRRRDLTLIAPPGAGIAKTPATGLFHWPMSATTLYAGGALWLTNEAGFMACLDARKGGVRALERIPRSPQIALLSADPASRRLLALANGDVVELTPPERCWT
jgi:hypothetical protein